jgi:hypothetical protein
MLDPDVNRGKHLVRQTVMLERSEASGGEEKISLVSPEFDTRQF